MQICTDEGCAPTEDVDMAGPLGFASVEGQDGDSWTFSVGMTRLVTMSRCVRSPATAPCISEAEITAEWVSVGSSEQCGDPGEVTVTVQP